MPELWIGVSTKLYLGYRSTLQWMEQVCAAARDSAPVADGRVGVFVAPTAPALGDAVRLAAPAGVVVAAQDVSRYEAGPYTGEVGAPFLAELGVRLVEIGHAERRRLFAETDEVVAAKVAAAQDAGLLPLLCIGEPVRLDPAAAAAHCVRQVTAAVAAGPVLLAYEPVWAIGATRPAPPEYVRAVVAALKAGLPAPLAASRVVYGGSAGPGLLADLRPEVDGLFLGRFAHQVANVRTVLAEAGALTAGS